MTTRGTGRLLLQLFAAFGAVLLLTSDQFRIKLPTASVLEFSLAAKHDDNNNAIRFYYNETADADMLPPLSAQLPVEHSPGNHTSTTSSSDNTIIDTNGRPSRTSAGRLWICGYPYKTRLLLFPDYEYVGIYTRSTDDDDIGPNDLLVVGMFGPGVDMPTIQKKFATRGKVLFINGERFGQIPDNNNNNIYQISGPVTKDMSYSADTNPQSHFLQVFHGARLFVEKYSEHFHLLFDPSQRPRWNGFSTTTTTSTTTSNPSERAVIYISSHCVPHRQEAATLLSSILPVHTGGSCTVPTAKSVTIVGDRKNRDSNWKTYSKYKYCISMENDPEPISGYMSEKIIFSFLGGCIPIYWGSKDVFDIFNPDAFLFMDTSKNPQVTLDRIAYLERNDTAYEEMSKVPILKNGTDTINRYFSFSDSIGDGSLKRQIREMIGIVDRAE